MFKFEHFSNVPIEFVSHLLSVTPHLFIGGWDFWNIIEGGSRFSWWGCLKKGEQCFPLVMHGFCSNDAIYSASLSFTLFIFLLTLFDTFSCYYFKSDLSLLMHVKVLFIKKHIILFCSLLNMKKQFSLFFKFP